MSSPTDKLDIVVGDFPTDAMLCNINGVRTLFLGVDQTFSRAVNNVRNVLPGITVEAAERMIREQCPEFRDLDELLGITDPVPQSVEGPAVVPFDEDIKQLPRDTKWRRKAFLVAALLPALFASWAMGRYSSDGNATPTATASAQDATPDAETVQAPFADPKFQWFSGSSDISCNPMSTLEAECTDTDGMVMSTKAATGPDSTIFTFSYGSERIGLRIFYDAEYAKTWASQDGSRELYPHMRVHGRYVLWGTDPGRIKEYNDLLVEADKQKKKSGPTAMGGATPLPPRLAALTLGTLGLDDREVRQIIALPPAALSDAPAVFAARLVLGLDSAPTWPGLDPEDIVALAAGLEPKPPTAGPAAGGTPVVAPVTEAEAPAAPSTTTTTPPPSEPEPAPSTTPTSPTTSTPPPTTEPAPTDPEPSTPPSTPPATESPAPVEETPAPAEEIPAPVEETPAPVETPAEGGTPPGQDGTAPPGQDDGGDDLLILDSAWTVSAA